MSTRGKVTKRPTRALVLLTERLLFPADQGYRVRIIELIRALRSSGYRVILVSKQIPDWRARILTRRLVDGLEIVDASAFPGGRLDGWSPDPFSAALAAAVRRHAPIAVIAECLWMAPCLQAVPDGVMRVADALDVMHTRGARFGDQNGGAWVECTRDEEAGALAAADVVIAIQRNEQAQLRQMLPDRAVVCVPHPVRPVRLRRSIWRDRDVVAFVGSDNAGNRHGLERFVDEAWPAVRERRPGAELRVYGKVVRRLRGGGAGVTLVGRVRRLETAYGAARVVINPVELGTGLKIKSVEALAYGRALVTTSCGADGLEDGADAAFLVRDDMERFGAAVAGLLGDEWRRRALERGAHAFVERSFSREACLRELVQMLDAGAAAYAVRHPRSASRARSPQSASPLSR